MQTEPKKHLESILKPYLKECGFKKRGSTWRRSEKGFIQVINIQGSQWSKRFYVNLGIYISGLTNKELPVEADCHIRTRLEEICGPDSGIIDLLNYEDYSIEEQPRQNIISFLNQSGVPWLEKCSNFEAAKVEYTLPGRVSTKWQRDLLDKYFAQ